MTIRDNRDQKSRKGSRHVLSSRRTAGPAASRGRRSDRNPSARTQRAARVAKSPELGTDTGHTRRCFPAGRSPPRLRWTYVLIPHNPEWRAPAMTFGKTCRHGPRLCAPPPVICAPGKSGQGTIKRGLLRDRGNACRITPTGSRLVAEMEARRIVLLHGLFKYQPQAEDELMDEVAAARAARAQANIRPISQSDYSRRSDTRHPARSARESNSCGA